MFTEELKAYNKASYALLYCHTPEEQRCAASVQEVTKNLKSYFGLWTVTSGWKIENGTSTKYEATDPVQALKTVEKFSSGIYALVNFHPYLENPETIQVLKDLVGRCRAKNVTLIFISNAFKIPVELQRDFARIEFSMPDEAELKECLEKIAKNVPTLPLPEDTSRLIDAGKGLTYSEYSDALALTVVKNKKWDTEAVLKEKVKVLEQSNIRYYKPNLSMKDVGGLDNLKDWATAVSPTFGKEAKEAGIRPPKGLLLVGVPGCGKSYVMKALANAWQIPLLWGDIAASYSRYLGETEEKMKYMFEVARTMSPCILGIDELEKGIAGFEGGGQTSGGVPNRVLGILLTEMQENSSSVVIVATANEAWKLPAPLVRRFDEVFFVDLPSEPEREEIFRIHLAPVKADIKNIKVDRLSSLTHGFSGAEIEKVCRKAQISAFAKGTKLNQSAVENAISGIVPVSVAMQEEVATIRAWAKARAIPASKVQSFDITTERKLNINLN